MKVYRSITQFSNQTEEYVGEYLLNSFDLPLFQEKFEESDSNDPMYACYPVCEIHISFLSGYLDEKIQWDSEKYSYFLEATSI
ncbi:TPA: hypothetical protein NK329_000365 [Vibrio parahaemolyticus]|nr:hypothetical protein [Vibrio parahaemolyticus]